MQAIHRKRLFRRSGHRDVFADFARALERMLSRRAATPRVRRALR